MASWIGLDKLITFIKIIRSNCGISGSFSRLYRYDSLKLGTHVGTDKYGNRYYENPYYFYATNRWVQFADYLSVNYDGSMIPAEWFGWMHYKTDLIPTDDPNRPTYSWISDHSENLSGTKEAYMPYSTTRPKIIPWDPKNSPK